MRIALISPYPPLKGGIARFSCRLAAAFEEAGHELIRISFRRLWPEWAIPGHAARDAAEPGAEVPETLQLDLLNPATWVSVARTVRQLAPDIVLVACWNGLFAPLTAVMRQVSGIRTVVLLHNFTPHERIPFEPLFRRLLVAAADGFLTLSRTVQHDLDPVRGRKPARCLFHPVYEPSGVVPDRGDARRELGLGMDERVLLFFGYVRRYKGLETLFAALALARRRDPSLRLVVAGTFIGRESEFRELAGRLGIADAVDMHPGYVPADRVGLFFSAADAVVLPYRSATQSGVIPLAIGYGVPVIASAAGDLRSQVVHGRSGWIVAEEGALPLAEGILGFFSASGPLRPDADGIAALRQQISWAAFAGQAAAFLASVSREGGA